ncbi:MAG: DUF1415 domain-containing protein [Oleiphilaceae bacterium]|nr:DUF1415 domain-containing protein [Oleiphilaceae bacterium]
MGAEDSHAVIRAEMTRWLERFVVGLNLCPFARQPLAAGLVRIQVTDAASEESLLEALQEELVRLDQTAPENLETTLLVMDSMLQDFSRYNEFLYLANALLQDFGWEGQFQIASFHPHYQFAGTGPGDAENYTNRAPWPTLHLLREDRVEQALESHPDPEAIPDRNIRRMNRLGSQTLAQWLAQCRGECP